MFESVNYVIIGLGNVLSHVQWQTINQTNSEKINEN